MKRSYTYWPNCSVCQYMKKHKEYRAACLRSTYFDPKGTESLLQVNEKWGYPVKQQTLYRHMQRHQVRDLQNAEAINKLNGVESPVWQRKANAGPRNKVDAVALTNTQEVIEAPVITGQEHELGLDEFIQKGREKIATGQMSFTAANYITAIKVKSDIEKNTKDRRLEMLRSMFQGAAPKGQDE